MLRLALALCLSLPPVVLLTPTASAAAPDQDARARQAFDEGRAHYDGERFTEAAASFHEAWQLSQRHGLLLNVGLAQVQAGEVEAAAASLVQYRSLASPELQVRASAALDELEQRLSDAGYTAPQEVRVTALPEPVSSEGLAEESAEPPETAASAPEPSEAPSGEEPAVAAPAVVEPEPTEVPEPLASAPAKPTPSFDDDLPTLVLAAPPPARGAPRWGLVATGVTTLATGSLAAGITYSVSRGWLETGDRASYVALRPVNHGAIAMAGVGAGLTALGVTMRRPQTQNMISVSPWVSPGEPGVGLSVTANLVQSR